MLMEQEEKIIKIKQILEDASGLPFSTHPRKPLKVSLYRTQEGADDENIETKKAHKGADDDNMETKKAQEGADNDNIETKKVPEKIKNIRTQIDEIKQKILQARAHLLKNKTIKNLIVNGTVEVTGKTNVKHLNVGEINEENFDNIVSDCVRYGIIK